MKKIISALLIFTLILGCMFVLSSCKKEDDEGEKPAEGQLNGNKEDDEGEKPAEGQLSGTYVYKNDEYSYELSYEFSGDKITATMKDDDMTMIQKGTYVINEAGDTITFTIVEDGETETFDCDFAKGDGYIIINDDKFIKQ